MKGTPSIDVSIMEVNAVARGVTIDTLMDHAGKVVAEVAEKHLPPPPAKVGLLCGGGNNGGDGMAAAYYLRIAGYLPILWLLKPPEEFRTKEALRRWEMLKDLPEIFVGVPRAADLKGIPLAIDAMIGTGGKGELKEPYRSAVAVIQSSKVPVLSVDLPTGLGTSTPLKAKWTIALEVMKEGMEGKGVGTVTVRSIGIPPEAREETGPGEFLLFRKPDRTTSKGESGRLVVVGGGPYTGAPAIAALSALHAGCDLAFVVSPEPAATVIRSYSPNLIVRSVGTNGAFVADDAEALWKTVDELRPTAILVGNGSGRERGTLQALRHVVERGVEKNPVVLDADGTWLATIGKARPSFGDRRKRLLLTPNRRELTNILGHAPSGQGKECKRELLDLAKELGASLLLKGETDIMTDGDDVRENKTHHPAMVVGGAGDVLAGLVASLMARGLSAFHASRLGTYWLGSVSLSLFERLSYGMVATDLIDGLPSTLKEGLKVQSRGGSMLPLDNSP